MCLAIPGKLIEIFEEHGLKMGRVDYSGTVKTACLEYVPEVAPGQYVIVHAGFAISVLDEEEAQKSLELWSEIAQHLGSSEESEGPPASPAEGGGAR
ncbi:MAG: HypC/HybG/HupF family hydrogenase formation chaperone [Planctomycetota bacterium]